MPLAGRLRSMSPRVKVMDSEAMTREAIKKALSERQFRRFSVRLPDGRMVQIKGGHTAAVHPRGNTMIVFEDQGGYRIVDIALITELQTA